MGNNRKKYKRSMNKALISISTIVALNLLGISYAFYTDSLSINTSVSTGSMEPYFIESNVRLVGNNDYEYINLEVKDKVINITGVVNDKYNNNLFINIGDNGTIPFILKDLDVIKNDDIIKSIKVSEGNNQVKLHIKANDEDSVSQHSFKYELLFEQWQ